MLRECFVAIVFMTLVLFSNLAFAQEGLLVRKDGNWVTANFSTDELKKPGRLCIRYNNYWCLKSASWQGETGADSRGHAKFESAVYGARAFFITMRSYRFRHGLRSSYAIFNRYAPASDCVGSLKRDSETGKCPLGENPSLLYAKKVAEALGLDVNDDIKLFDDERRMDVTVAKTLARAVLQFELGKSFNVSDELLIQGIEAAGIKLIPE